MKLFLDDCRSVVDYINYVKNPIYADYEWIVVRNYEEFCKYLINNDLPELISFDHDLADEHYEYVPDDRLVIPVDEAKIDYNTYKERTGYDCAKFLVDYCHNNDLKLPKYLVHSMNPVGKENILAVLNKF